MITATSPDIGGPYKLVRLYLKTNQEEERVIKPDSGKARTFHSVDVYKFPLTDIERNNGVKMTIRAVWKAPDYEKGLAVSVHYPWKWVNG